MDLKHRVLFLMALSSGCVYESRSFSPVEVRVGGLEGGAWRYQHQMQVDFRLSMEGKEREEGN